MKERGGRGGEVASGEEGKEWEQIGGRNIWISMAFHPVYVAQNSTCSC